MPGILRGSKKASEVDFCPADVRDISGRRGEDVTVGLSVESALFLAALDERFRLLHEDLREVVAALYNTALLQNPDAFAIAIAPSLRPIPASAAAGVEVYKNAESTPVLVRVQAEMDTASGISSFLSLGRTPADAVATTGAAQDYRVGPRASLLLPPNTSCYAFASSPSGADTVNLVVTVVPFYGRAVAFTKG